MNPAYLYLVCQIHVILSPGLLGPVHLWICLVGQHVAHHCCMTIQYPHVTCGLLVDDCFIDSGVCFGITNKQTCLSCCKPEDGSVAYH